ncbi:MAG: type II CRISPR RNA-guided endonuclease Cas9 [Lentisphaerae bacterium]|nr:type II CRISPR RNA-guided endonuclease Cas9 [Lentisphaerota bacterium]
MKNSKKSDYFVGLDIGTNSVGYAAAYESYQLIKYRQHPVWGVHLFEEAQLANERRTFRAARRRLDRRQQRIQLLRELFASEIGAVDPGFFHRINSSSLKKGPDEIPYGIFADSNYTDRNFYKQYPTIHHLIAELIDSNEPHDIRLIYVACAWLLAHRGHFFSDVAKEKVDEIIDFQAIYSELESFTEEHNSVLPWKHCDIAVEHIGHILKSSNSRTDKYKTLAEYLQVKNKKSDEEQWFDASEFLRMLCGLEGKFSKLFPNTDLEDIKLSLDADDEKITEAISQLDEDNASLLLIMKKIFDWSVLADIVGDDKNLSSSKVRIYEKHKSDLKALKYLVKKYLSPQDYRDIFRAADKNNYAAYCGRDKLRKIKREDFYTFIKGKLKNIKIEDTDVPEAAADKAVLDQINQDIAIEKFLPKQVVSDNRTVPYQLYWNELRNLLLKASVYLPFLIERDPDGLSVMDKVLSIMEFRIPYFVGPLNAHSDFSWLRRKAEGRILPWNFKEKVDLDACENEFINRMINRCTYLPNELVLPEHSLLYQRFKVLNLINMIHINGSPVSVECKQKIYGLFLQYSKVTKKTIVSFLISNNFYSDITENSIIGIDDTVTAALSSWKIFMPFLESKKLTENEVEQIISQRAFTEDRTRFQNFLKKFPNLDSGDIKKISSKNFQGFGRLSEKFLTEPLYFDPVTGNQLSIINMLWEYNFNLQQLMSDKFPFAKYVERERKAYYSNSPLSLSDRLDEMYISNSVKRPIIRTLTILDEITRTMGYPPAKIFVEMARDVDGTKKKQRTVSRMAQLQELYREIADDDTRRLSQELERYDESALQRDVLYLYFMQLGRDMYTGDPITDLKLCDKEHIYPQSKVKDDSILDNIVLVNSKANGAKSDSYPIDAEIRHKMLPFWQSLRDKKLISDEKFYRLTRSTPFSDDEQWGFINRQLVETRQSTKVITELLKERYPESEVVYVKAGLVSDFRHEFGFAKSRTINDLHHAKDAYLNIVVGNVYSSFFTRNWFAGHTGNYSLKIGKLFSGTVKTITGSVVWNGEQDIASVAKNMQRNYLHLSNYSYCQHGGLFDQNPLSAAEDLIPLKKGKPTGIYGGYRKPSASFFIFALTEIPGKKKTVKELTLVPVDLMVADRFLRDENVAVEYVKKFTDPTGKKELTVQFPLGLKPIKIKTVFEVDNGLRFMLNGKSGGGRKLLIAMASSLLLDNKWEAYIKHLESYCEKKKKNPKHIYSEEFDRFSILGNIELYDILLNKLSSGLFSKRPANPAECLKTGRETFISLTPEKQAEILLGIINSFGRGSGSGVDLSQLGGVANAAVTTISSNLSNWKKIFSAVHIVYSDASGLHETKSINLLELM